MPTEPRRARSGLLTASLVAIPALCCLTPWLIAAGAAGVALSWLTNPWVILVTVLVVVVLVTGAARRRGRSRSRPT
jgi:membrane protein implicated in regulation of membrane protease activity